MKGLLLAASIVAVSAFADAETLSKPPTAPQKPYTVKGPQERNDLYYWLRDDSRKNPEMLAYIQAENAYADAVLAATKPLQDTLFKEIVGHIKQDDSSAPVRHRGYYYYYRNEIGQEYPIIARKLGSLQAKERVMLDE